MTPLGVVTLFTDPGFANALGITAGPDGNLWFTDTDTDSIGRITPSGAVTMFPASPGRERNWGTALSLALTATSGS